MWTGIHGLGRVLLKRGIDHVIARRSVLGTANVIERGSETATETEIDFRGETVRGVVARAAETVGSITHTRVGIGRWQKEWDCDLIHIFFCRLWILDGTRPNIVYSVRNMVQFHDLVVRLTDQFPCSAVSVTYCHTSCLRYTI